MYSMVTVSPALGIAPEPSLRTVLVTAMIADVREKFRIVGVVVGIEDLASLKILVDEENMVRICGRERSLWGR